MHNENVVGSSVSNPSRTGFIRKVYLNLFLAIAGFTGLEVLWFSTGVAESVWNIAAETNWLIFIGAFMLVSWLASRLATPGRNLAVQYAGLSLYVLLESLIFIPLLVIANYYGGFSVISKAAYITLGGFAVLTAVVFFTRVDLSGYAKYLVWGGILALGAIVASVIFGFELGTYFSLAMVGFAGFAILYDTSKILHTHDDSSYVAASMQLFASIALLFWYVLRLSSSRD